MTRELRTYLPEDVARRDTARALDDACFASGLSNADIGASLGCDESYVRAMRHGVKPISAHRVVQLPLSVARPFAASKLASNEAHRTPLTAATTEAQAAALNVAAAELSAEISRRGADGKIDGDDLLAILAKFGLCEAIQHRLRVVAGVAR